MKYILVVMLSLSLFDYKSTFGQAALKIHIDPSKSYGGTVSEYFNDVQYITLETTKESLFGDVYQLIITDSSYVIKDLDTQKILFFSLDGKFITKVEYSSLMFLDKVRNQVALLSFRKGPTQVGVDFYNLVGTKSSSEIINIQKDETAIDKIFFIPLEKNYYLGCNSCFVDKQKNDLLKPCYFLSLYKNDSLSKQFLPLEEKKSTAVSRIWGNVTPPTSINNKSVYVSTPLDFNIYKITKDTAVKLYQLVFPQNRVLSLNILESQNTKFLDSIQTSLMKRQTIIIDIENIFFTNSKLFFKVITPSYTISTSSSENEYQYNFAYDTISHKLVSLDRIVPDVKSYFLPIMGERSKNKGFIPYKQSLYGYISSLALFAAKEKNKSKNPQYIPKLQEYFNTQNRKSNPVIVKMTLRE